MDGAIVVRAHGGPEVLEWTRSDPGQPGPGEVLIRHTAVGLNYIDVYQREGLYPLALPFTPGVEGAGRVESVGEGVADLSPGDAVAYTGNGPAGSYRESRVLPRSRLVPLPDDIDEKTAAAIMLKGCTVEYLVRRTFPIHEGHVVLLHAAAGGVGLIAGQWLNSLGATVIGTVGSEEKAELARANGCHHTILYREQDVAQRTREITDGVGVHVVYDSVGAATFEGSIASLRPRGMMVTYGNASGPVEPMRPLVLAQGGSLFLTRPTLGDYYASAEDSADGCAALFEMVTSGKVRPHIGQTFAVEHVGEAHRALEARETVGSTVLTVGS
ncbi:MAG: quinone oxidoreductase [Gemmatimonadota bacterium]|nr:quinone oxidoreductase [Gemmatimonadota bacterium]